MNLNRRAVVLSSIGLMASTTIVLILTMERSWDNPRISPRVFSLQSSYGGNVWLTKVVCRCPDHLVQGKSESLTLSLDVSTSRVDQARVPAPAKETATSAPTPDNGLKSVATELPKGKEPMILYLTYMNGGKWANFDNGLTAEWLVDGNGNPAAENVYTVSLNPKSSLGPVRAIFATDVGQGAVYIGGDLATASLDFEMKAPFARVALPYALYAIVLAGVVSLVFYVDDRMRKSHARQEAKLAQAKELAVAHPERSQFTWQLAQARLEKYFDGNLSQVRLVFWLAVVVMAAGFAVVLWGIDRSLNQGTSITPGVGIAAGAGVITQFLGATFLVLYRSTMKQANDFILVLDRINNVGMAMQVLDQIPDDPSDLKNQARSKIIEHLLLLKDTTTATDITS